VTVDLVADLLPVSETVDFVASVNRALGFSFWRAKTAELADEIHVQFAVTNQQQRKIPSRVNSIQVYMWNAFNTYDIDDMFYCNNVHNIKQHCGVRNLKLNM